MQMTVFLPIIFAMQAVTGIVSEPDPITDQRAYGLLINEDDNSLFVGCKAAGKREFDITLLPDDYYGARSDMFFTPTATHRFDDNKPVVDQWVFLDKHLSHFDMMNKPVKRNAEFIDALVKSKKLVVRYEAISGSVKTVTFNYQIDAGDMRRVLEVCAPPKLTEYLKTMQSPAMPDSTVER
jgi:hypothetical protein